MDIWTICMEFGKLTPKLARKWCVRYPQLNSQDNTAPSVSFQNSETCDTLKFVTHWHLCHLERLDIGYWLQFQLSARRLPNTASLLTHPSPSLLETTPWRVGLLIRWCHLPTPSKNRHEHRQTFCLSRLPLLWKAASIFRYSLALPLFLYPRERALA